MPDFLIYLLYCTVLVTTAQAAVVPSCKASPGSPDWPLPSAWATLNHTVAGRLLKPLPPGAACHPKQPTYNKAVCPALKKDWATIFFHQDNPISSAWNNFNNDSCLPESGTPCSGEGYPVYVVNATTPAHVQVAVHFAAKHNVRLIVKGTGHDYLGRYVSQNSSHGRTYNQQIHRAEFAISLDSSHSRNQGFRLLQAQEL